MIFAAQAAAAHEIGTVARGLSKNVRSANDSDWTKDAAVEAHHGGKHISLTF